jgi:hypothetical protein
MRAADYEILLSVIAPHIDLATDGKEPALGPFSEAIATVLKRAGNAAYRAMGRSDHGMSIREAAWMVMPDAYAAASGNGIIPRMRGRSCMRRGRRFCR